jgi:polar amino acid transport system substrate-binding protein
VIRALAFLYALLLVLVAITQVWAVEPVDDQGARIVGVVEAPPFAMKDGNGNWGGIAVRLWRHVASDLRLQYELREMSPPDLLAAIEDGKLAAVVTAVATAERERLVDFSHPYYSTGLGIAVPEASAAPDWFVVIGNLVSWSFLKIIGLLVLVLMIAGSLVWVFERRVNPEHFSGGPLKGIADGLWWAAVTMTTVGYGDKAPRTRAGRIIGGIWMFAAVLLISVFTAHITSTLTVTGLAGRVRGPADLPHVRVGTLRDSAAQAQLRAALGLAAGGYDSFADGLEALARGEIDAFVAGEPILRYEVVNRFRGRLQVLGSSFMREDYAFALPLDSPLRRNINESLLRYIDTEEWRTMVRAYMGQERSW